MPKENKCMYCGNILSYKNVFMFSTRGHCVDKCDACTNRLERGEDMHD